MVYRWYTERLDRRSSKPRWLRKEKQLLEELKRSRVFASLRYVTGIGGIRTAVHESNTAADVDALLDVARRFLAKSKKRAK